VFKHKGLSSASLTAPASNAGGAGLTTAAWSANSNCHWNLSFAKGVILRDTATGRSVPSATIKYLEQGHDYDLSDLKINWEYYGSLIGGQVWSGNNYNMVDVHSNTGQLTANNFGTSTVTIRTTLDGISYSASYKVTVVPSSGTYFLRNKTTGMYADIYEHTMSNGTEIIQEKFIGNGTQRWVFTHLGDGIFTIHSDNAATRFYLGVSGDSTAVNQPIVLRTGTVTDGMKWKIELTSSGAFKLTPKTGIANDYVLATSTSDATSGAALVQGAYFENESYRDEWTIYTHTDYTFMFIGYHVGDPLMPPILTSITQELNNEGIAGNAFTTLGKDDLIVYLATSTVFSCITHGLETLIVTSDFDLTISDINALDNEAFTNLDFVYLGACLTGLGKEGSTNLVNAFASKGASTVLGFTVKIPVDETNYWTERFFVHLANGMTIADAITEADADMALNQDLNDSSFTISSGTRYIVGEIGNNPWDIE
jgi:hypothetical protein